MSTHYDLIAIGAGSGGLSVVERASEYGAKTAGHPEVGHIPGIEATTGPLGQGIANAVGMAIAQKKYEAKLGPKICNYNVYAIVGDGCL